MAYLIGTDEAGYGPNLGPLIVSATTWRVSDNAVDCDLYELLGQMVAKDHCDDSKIPIADSKALYRPGQGVAYLERGLFTVLGALGSTPVQWRDVWKILVQDALCALEQIPWYQEYAAKVPSAVAADGLAGLTAAFLTAQENSRTNCRAIQSVAIFPKEFNESVVRYGNKAELLSLSTLSLVRNCLSACEDFPIRVQCDKHGGRNKYAALLQHVFPEHFVEVVHESRAESIYRWGPRKQRVEIRFVARGERFLPSALASMASKYLRELAMQAFNDFWRRHLPNLRPTAGYPIDARRFRDDIEKVRKKLRIDMCMLWRDR